MADLRPRCAAGCGRLVDGGLRAVAAGRGIAVSAGDTTGAGDAVRARAGAAVINGARWLVAAITVQATLGIFTLLHQVPIDLALAHQAVAIVVLTLAVLQAERLAAHRSAQGRQELVLPAGQPG